MSRISGRLDELRKTPAEPDIEKLAPMLQEQLTNIAARFTDREALLDKIRNMETDSCRMKERNDYLERADLHMRDERDLLRTNEASLKVRLTELESQHRSLQERMSRDDETGQAAAGGLQTQISALEAEITAANRAAEVAEKDHSDTVDHLKGKIEDSEVTCLPRNV